jgi:hypothetical protein
MGKCTNRIISRKQLCEVDCPRPAAVRLPFRLTNSEYLLHLCVVCAKRELRQAQEYADAIAVKLERKRKAVR